MATKLNFCTLFDSGFVARGLALYDSLAAHCSDFHLYVYAFDDATVEVLGKLNLPHATIIELKQFEDPELLKVKPSRSRGEYCWTCTPSIIRHAIKNFDLDHCTYLDADLYFFSSPEEKIHHFLKSSDSVLITPHNYSAMYDKSCRSGIFCVQFMPFKNDEAGMKVLDWWRKSCIEWCYDRVECGKFGDQKYLDHWPEQFDGIKVETSDELALAPWNIQKFNLNLKDDGLVIQGPKSDKKIVFYHFHGLKFYINMKDPHFGWYFFKREDIELIYRPYLLKLEDVIKKYELDSFGINYLGKSNYKKSLKDLYRTLRSFFHRAYFKLS